MSTSRLINFWRYQGLILSFREYQAVCATLHRQNDLTQLIQWATRKSLSKPKDFYLYLLAQEELQLLQYTYRCPRIILLAKIVTTLNAILNPIDRDRYKRGYASYYKFKTHKELAYMPTKIMV